MAPKGSPGTPSPSSGNKSPVTSSPFSSNKDGTFKRKEVSHSPTSKAEEDNPKNKLKLKPDEMDLDTILKSICNEDVLFQEERCLPENVKINLITGRMSPVWNFSHIGNAHLPKYRATQKVLMRNRLKITMKAQFLHICIECLQENKDLGNTAHSDSWARALFKVSNTSNENNHLANIHASAPSVIAHFVKKKTALRSKGLLDSGGNKKLK